MPYGYMAIWHDIILIVRAVAVSVILIVRAVAVSVAYVTVSNFYCCIIRE